MKILLIKLLVNQKLKNAEYDFNQAGSEKLVESCQKYLSLLIEHSEELDKFRSIEEISHDSSPALFNDLIEQARLLIQAEVEETNQKRSKTESLLKSFTSITGYEAVRTFNQLEYKGFNQWELRADEIRLKEDTNGEKFSLEEAIKIAEELRRKAFVIYKTNFID